MEFLLSFAYTAFFLFLISKLRFFKVGIPILWLQGAFILKIIFGILLWAVYTYYYTDRSGADIYKYFDPSEIMFSALFTHPVDYFKMLTGIRIEPYFHDMYLIKMNHWYKQYSLNLPNDNRTIIRFNALARLFSGGYYQVHAVFMNFLSFIGLISIFKTFSPFLKNKKKELFFSVFFIPSLLFWGSGVLKEGLILFSMGIMLLSYKNLLENKFSVKVILIFIFGFWLMLITKIYVLIALIPAMLSLLLLKFIRTIKPSVLFLSILILFLVDAGFIGRIIPSIQPLKTLAEKQRNFINLGMGGLILVSDSLYLHLLPQDSTALIATDDSLKFKIRKGSAITGWIGRAGKDSIHFVNQNDSMVFAVVHKYEPSNSFFEITHLDGNPAGFIKMIPEALFNSLLRPLPGQARSFLMLFACAENFALFLLFVFILFFSHKKFERPEWAWFCLSFVIMLFLIIGWTTPIIGALVRYKIPALLFLIIFFLFLYDKEKLLIRFPVLKKYLSDPIIPENQPTP